VKGFRTQQQVLVSVARYTPQGLLVWALGEGEGCHGGSNHRLIKCSRDSSLCIISNGFEAVENVGVMSHGLNVKMKQIACVKTRKFCVTEKKAPQCLILILHNKIRKRSVDPNTIVRINM